eukprot:RCo030686
MLQQHVARRHANAQVDKLPELRRGLGEVLGLIEGLHHGLHVDPTVSQKGHHLMLLHPRAALHEHQAHANGVPLLPVVAAHSGLRQLLLRSALVVGKHADHPKVAELAVSVVRHQDVLGVDVQVDNPVRPQAGQPTQHLQADVRQHRLGQGPEAVQQEVQREVDVLHQNVQTTPSPPHLVAGDEVLVRPGLNGVVHLILQAALGGAQHHLADLSVHRLDRELLPALLVLVIADAVGALEDRGKGALAQLVTKGDPGDVHRGEPVVQLLNPSLPYCDPLPRVQGEQQRGVPHGKSDHTPGRIHGRGCRTPTPSPRPW